jgi:hypothetical protein
MDTNQNELLGKNLTDLIATPEDVQGLTTTGSATAEEILNPVQSPTTDQVPPTGYKPVKLLEPGETPTEPPTGKPVKVEAGILSDVRNSVIGKVQGSQNQLQNFDLNEYSKYMGNNFGVLGPREREDRTRAENQTATEQFKHAVGQIGVNILPEIASQIANILDIEDYNNSDMEVGNSIQRWADGVKQWSDKTMGIYQTDPNKPLNVGDSGWWFKNGSSLVTSAGAFVATGYLAGGLTSFASLRGAKALKMATTLGQDASLSAKSMNTLNTLNTLGTALMLNQAESLGIGVETYNESYIKYKKELEAQDMDGIMTADEIENKSKELASKDAASAINFNKWNILLNLTSANMFLKSPSTTRNLLRKNTKMESARQVLGEGFQEYAEENVNDISKGQATDRDYGFKDAMAYVMSAEGLEAGLLGFAGGVGQTVLTKAGKYIPMYKNKEYFDAYRSAYNSAPEGLGDKEKDAYAREQAAEVAFSTNDRVSEKDRFNARYAKQQEVLEKYNTNTDLDNVNDVATNLANAEFMLSLTDELEASQGISDVAKKRTLERLALSQTVQNAFQSGTTESLINLYESYGKLTHDEAEERGLYTKGDEGTKDYYKTKVAQIVSDIETLEKEYVKSREFVNSNEVYNLNEININVNKDIEELTRQTEDMFSIAETLFKDSPELHPGKEGGYRDATTKTGFNLIAVNPKFRETSAYENIKELNDSNARLRRLSKSTTEKLQKITTRAYQAKLKTAIDKIRKAQARSVEAEEAFARHESKKEDNRNTITKLRDKLKRKKEEEVVVPPASNTETVTRPRAVAEEETEETEEEEEVVPPAPPVSNEEEETPASNKNPNETYSEALIDIDWSGVKPFSKQFQQIVDQESAALTPNMNNPDISLETKITELRRIRQGIKENQKSFKEMYPTDPDGARQMYDAYTEAINKLLVERERILNDNDSLKQQQRALIEALEEEGTGEDNTATDSAAKTRPDYSKSMAHMQQMADALANTVASGIEESDFVGIVKSFEEATSKARMIISFPKFKALYNAVNQSGVTIEGTYDEVILGKQELETVLDRVDGIMKFHKPTETYTSDLDTQSQEYINMYETLAQFNGVTAQDSGIGFQIYNQQGADLLAFLAKEYKEAFDYKVTKGAKDSPGKKYVAVTKMDIDNVINNLLDQRILSTSILTKGKVIQFVPLDQVTLENGKIRHADGNIYNANGELFEQGDGAGTAPIGIMVDGKLLEKVYLHDTTWINATNLDAAPPAMAKDRAALKAFKQSVIDKGSITSEITYRSGGIPILDNSGVKMSVAERTPNVTVGVVKGGAVVVGEDKKARVKNINYFKEGKSVIVIPHGQNSKGEVQQLALPVNNSKLSKEYIESIISATRTYLLGQATDNSDEIEKKTDTNLLNINGLENYINKFISLRGVSETNSRVKDFKEFKSALSTYEDNAHLVQITGSQIFYGRGAGIDPNFIGTSKYKNRRNAGELIEQDLAHFRHFLKNVYTHVNTSVLGKDVKLPILEDGKITKIHTDYTSFVKENLMSQYLSIKLDSGEEVYTIQPIIRYKMDIGEVAEAENVEEEEDFQESITPDTIPEIETDGDSDLDFGDMTDFSFSPATIVPDTVQDINTNSFDMSPAKVDNIFTDEFIKELRASYSFIEGVSVGDKQAIVKTIVNSYYKDIILDAKEGKVIRPLKEHTEDILSKLRELSTKMQAQLAMKDNPNLAKPNFISIANHIIKQAEILNANKTVIIEDAKKAISRKKNTIAVDKEVDSTENNEDGQDEEETNTKSILFNVSEYTVDPKSGLTDSVRYMLESVREYTVVEKKDRFGEVVSTSAKPRTNVLGLNSYVAVNTTFESIKSILSKSNDNFGYTSATDINNKIEYKEGTPDYIKYIISTLDANVKGKPYLQDVIDMLQNATPQVQNQFATNFNGHATNHIFLMSDYNKKDQQREIRRTVAASRNTSALVLSEWQNNLYYKNLIKLHEGKRVLSTEAVRNFNELYRALVKGDISMSHSNINRVLSEIGVSIPLDLYLSLYTDKYKKNGEEYDLYQMFSLKNGLFRNIYERVVAFNTNKKGYLDLEVNNLFENSAFRDLSHLVSKYRKDLTTNSFRNGNGDMIYGFSNSRYAPDRTLRLKSNAALIKGLNNDPFSSNSMWLKGLTNKDEDGNISINTDSRVYHYLKYYTSDSLKIKGMDEMIRGRTIDNLPPRDLERYHWGLFMNNGMFVDKSNDPTPIMNVVYPTMEEKSNTFVLQAPAKYIKLTANGNLSDATKEYLVDNLLQPEINRILTFQDGLRPNIIEMQKGGNMSILFPALHDTIIVGSGNAKVEVNLFDELGQLDKAVLTDSLLREALKSLITRYFVDMYHQKRKDWADYGIIEEDQNGEQYIAYMDGNYQTMVDSASVTRSDNRLKEVLLNYIINTSVAHMNIQQLFIGDPALFSDVKFKKDGSKTDAQNALDFAIATSANQVKRLTGHNGSKAEFSSELDEEMGVLVIKDAKVVSTAADYIEALIGKSGYRGINSSDAQELTTLKEHLKRMVKEGKIDQDVMDRVMTHYKKTGDVAVADVKLILNPYKPVYFNNFEKDGKMMNFYIKSSSYPLISSFTKGKPLDALRELMENEENGIDTVAFESAVKLGKPINVPNIFNLNVDGTTDGTITIPENWRDGLISVPREGHGNQQENPYDENVNNVNDGTQQAKLAFTNLLDVGGFVDPDTEEVVDGRTLSDKYLALYEEMYVRKYKKLIKDLGYDPETGSISNYAKLSKMLKNEGLGRNYSYNDVKGFVLNSSGTNFEVPLWAGNSAVKVEALLSSIVDNKIRKRKVRGKSLILASAAGTNVNTIDAIDESKVVRVGNWDGRLKAGYEGVDENGSPIMVSAEILVPFKFWDNNGKALKLKDFLNQDGTLDMNRLPAELLEIFSYRIPTSGINLMSNIKIVGFLPEGYGDMVIAPPDFVEQMGSDFDVDKLYTHMYNTTYDYATNSIKKITEANAGEIEAEQQRRRGDIATIEGNIAKLEEKIAGLEDGNPLKNREIEKLENWQDSLETEKAADILSLGDVRDVILENRILDIHKAILNNLAPEVQRARVRTLSFGELPRMAKVMEKGRNRKYFTPISQAQQAEFYTSARSGKAAVGVFSLNMIFNSVVQFVQSPMYFKEGVERDYAKYVIGIAGKYSNDINNPYIAGSVTEYKSVQIEGFMTSALDNGKEQLLGKLNINNYTFDFIRAAVQLGFDQETVLTIINQPSVKEYVINKGNRKEQDAIEPFEDDARMMIENTSLAEFQANFNSLDTKSELQLAVLSLFDSVSEKGRILKTAQSAINSDSSGIGKNLFYNAKKIDQILAMPKIGLVGAGQLIGEYMTVGEIEEKLGTNPDENVQEYAKRVTETIQQYEADGYVRYEDTLIKPKSLGGYAAVYATLTNGKMWQKFFPYQNSAIAKTLQTVTDGKSSRKSSVNEQANETANVFKHFKSFLISNTYKLFGDYSSIQDARTRLLYSSTENYDLGSIIFDLRQSNKYSNLLLDGFEIGDRNTVIDIGGFIPNSLNYFNAGIVEDNEEVLGAIIVDMLTNEKDLGMYNGEMWTTRKLMNAIITHQMINGGIQKGAQIIKYIPYEYLKELGYYNSLTNDLNVASGTGMRVARRRFAEQYMQHFPSEYYDEKINEDFAERVTGHKILLNEGELATLPYIILNPGGEQFDIYKFDEDTQEYNQIDTLGYKGNTEFDFTSDNAKSMMYINQVSTVDRIVAEVRNEVSKSSGKTEEEGEAPTVKEVYRIKIFKGNWSRAIVEQNPDKVFLFGDNTNDRVNTKHIPTSTQAVIRGLDNAIGIDTKKDRGTGTNSYFNNSDFAQFKQQVDEAILKAKLSGKTIVLPEDGIGTGKATLKEKAPKLLEYLQNAIRNIGKSNYVGTQEELFNGIKPTLVPTRAELLKTLFTPSTDENVAKGSVVKYTPKGQQEQTWIVWNINESGKVQLIKADGTRFTGTPLAKNVKPIGYYTSTVFNSTDYIVTSREKVYSLATGLMVYENGDNSTKMQKERIIKQIMEENGLSEKVEPTEEVQEEISNLERKEAELSMYVEAMKGQLDTIPEYIIITNLPKINPDSARKETGGKVGSNQDINPTYISKTGLSVEGAAEKIENDYFYENEMMDVQTIRDIIIDILTKKKSDFIEDITKENELREVRKELANRNRSTDSNGSAIVAQNESIPTIEETAQFLRVDRNTTQDTSTSIHKNGKQDIINQFYLEEENLSIEDKNRLILDEIADSSTNPILSHFAHVLKDVVYLLNDTPIKVDYTLGSKGVANSNMITGESMAIFINPNLIDSAEEMREVLMEEIIHGITKKSINDFNDGRPSKGNPIMIIDKIRRELIGKVQRDYGIEKWNSTMQKIAKSSPLMKGVEADLIYSLHNIEEFIAAAIKNPDFKTYLNNERVSDSTLNLWQRFIAAINDMLIALGVKKYNNLEAVLDQTLMLFDKIQKQHIQGVNRPKYYRSAEYLNSKFNLLDSSSSPIVKGNPQQIASYINQNIVNVTATVKDNTVVIKPTVSISIAKDMSAIIDDGLGDPYEGLDMDYATEDNRLRNAELYIMTMNDRINKLEGNLDLARNAKDYVKVEELDLLIAREAEKREKVYGIASVAALADESRKDFEIVENILKRDINIEDLRYAKYIINFWKQGMEYVFDEEHYTSTALTSTYGKIEGKAKALDLRLSKIEKKISTDFIKNHTGYTADLDEIFARYQDIGWAKADWRSVSTVDNALIVSNWAAIQNANIDARAEVERLLGDWDADLATIVPILKSLGNKNLFSPFVQYTDRGKNTNHIIRPYTDDFYKDRYAKINAIYKDKSAVSMNDYMAWAKGTGEEIDLNLLFPANNKITTATTEAREKFKAKIGATRYNYWEKEQTKVLEEYESRRKVKLEAILEEFKIAKYSEIGSVPDADIKYKNWTTRNSPYILSSNINKGLSFKQTIYAFNSQRYYVPIPMADGYLDARFKTIENNPELLKFYDKMTNILSELEVYVPQAQKQNIAYGGLPSVEKSLIEMYNEKGFQAGFEPIMEALVRSTQTSYTSDAKSELDVSTGKNKQSLRIPLIKNPYEEVSDYKKFKRVEYLANTGKEPTVEQLREFEEDAIDEIASRHSLDLGKVIKMYTSLVIGLKHKAKIEDYINNNNTVLDSYREVKRRPDGSPQQLGTSGEDALLEAKDSYITTKKMNQNYLNNVMYGDSRDEQGKGKTVMTPSEKARMKDLKDFQAKLDARKAAGEIENEEYESSSHIINMQMSKLGKTLIYSKVGDSVMKGVQLKVMGWNLLGGISNLGFGWIANQIEAAGGKTITKKQLAEGYRIAMLYKTEDGQKADNMVKNMDVLQESSYELQTSTTRGEANKKVKPLEPFMVTKITEAINQKPLMIALAKNFKVTTNQGQMSLWETLDTKGKWKSELGERPDAEFKRYQLKLIALIGRIHGNYDALSPMAGKRTIFGRAASQFRGWLPEAIASRFEDYRMDIIQDEEVKGRYRSVATMYSNNSKKDFASNLIKGFLRQWTFGKAFKDHDFSNLVDGENVRDIDAVNMRKFSMELVIALNLNLFLLMIASMFAGDDDEPGEAYNILFNQGTRMRTDLMLYVNPNEARNLIKDVIPAMSLVKDISDWNVAVFRALKGDDTIESGRNAGESRVWNATLKNFPITAKVQSIKSASEQVFDTTN